MGRIVAAMASSHAYTLVPPEQWDERRKFTRANYARRYGVEPADQPQALSESFEDDQVRYGRIRDGLMNLRNRLHASRPDALIMIGDDQDENYREDNLPQFAIYVGEKLLTAERGKTTGQTYRCDAELARAILQHSVEAGFDLASSKSFPNNQLISHAHREVLQVLDPDAQIPVVPIFVNAIHVPAPTPARCYALGRTLRTAIESIPDDKRVMLFASGGLSHFTAGYPWPHYNGPYTLGSISQDFDRELVSWMQQGEGQKLAHLSSDDLLAHGEIELRQWIVLQGALGEQKPQELVYEPFYRGVMGMAVGYWDLTGAGVG